MTNLFRSLDAAVAGSAISDPDALALADFTDIRALMGRATLLRDQGFTNRVTYSRKIFIPLTHLCRDVCHYCTFAQAPKRVIEPYMSLDAVVALAREGQRMGCKEALFTLGERPELRYKSAREALAAMGYSTTLEYLRDAANAVFEQTGLLPHMNPGTMTPDECAMLREVSPSMGIMLESASARLCEKGMPHYGSPDKDPQVRLATLRDAGIARIPFTTGILIGIGETRLERIESLLAIRALHQTYGHIQEIIIQNFRAKADTKMHSAPEPDLDDMLWTLAVARVIFGPSMSIQAPPNLSPDGLTDIVNAGINDWGGVSPLTPDHVNPEAPWPHLDTLASQTYAAGKHLHERLTIYPEYVRDADQWVDSRFLTPLLQMTDAEGYPRTDDWSPGEECAPPATIIEAINGPAQHVSAAMLEILERVTAGNLLEDHEIEQLFKARGDDFTAVCRLANSIRREVNQDVVSFVVNRNINYTNVCYFKCQFCAFSKGKLSENLRGSPYDLEHEETSAIHGRYLRQHSQSGEICGTRYAHPRVLAARSVAGRGNFRRGSGDLPCAPEGGWPWDVAWYCRRGA